MKDLILGGGEVGEALKFALGGNVPISDIVNEISTYVGGFVECLHVCIPYDFSHKFYTDIDKIQHFCQSDYIIIHSTVPMGTTKYIQEMFPKQTVIYSPILGQHPNLQYDIRTYTKLYASYKDYINVDRIIHDRFEMCMHINKPETLELSKLVETTYLGLLVEFTKLIDELAHDDKDVWEVSRLADARHHNRPIMYNNHQPIGGHCVINNLKLFPKKIEGGYFDIYPVFDELVSILLHSAKEKICTHLEGDIKK